MGWSLTLAGHAAFEDASGSSVRTIECNNRHASTFVSQMQFDLHTEASCEDKKLTIDLRLSCSIEEETTATAFDVVTVFDVLSPEDHGTPGSANGKLEVWGRGCASDIPVFADCAVGIDGATPIGDLWQSLTFDFGDAGCTFASDVFMMIDSDHTTMLGSEASCRDHVDDVDDACDFCDLACGGRSGECITDFNSLEVQCCIGKEKCNENPFIGLGVDVACCSGEKSCCQSDIALPPFGVCCSSLESCYQTGFQTPEHGATASPITIQCEGEKACCQTDHSDADDQQVNLSCVGKEACCQVGKDGEGPSDGSLVECDGEKACHPK